MRQGLVEFMEMVEKVLEFGDKKHGGGVQELGVFDVGRGEKMGRAIVRHLSDGDRLDDETGLPHRAHIAANAYLLWRRDRVDVEGWPTGQGELESLRRENQELRDGITRLISLMEGKR